MSHSVSIDWETYSRADLTQCGSAKYAADPSTDLLCLGWAVDDEEVSLWTPDEPVPDKLRRAMEEYEVHAFGVQFEKNINDVVGKRYGFPSVPIERFRCTQARVRYANIGPSLDDTCETLGFDEADKKDKEGHKIMQKLCKPHPRWGHKKVLRKAIADKWTKTGKFKPGRPEESYVIPERWDHPLLYDEFTFMRCYEYCAQDVHAERLVKDHVPKLLDTEQKYWEFDRRCNERGIPVDVDFCKGAIEVLAKVKEEISDRMAKLTEHLPEKKRVTAGTQTQRILNFVNGLGVNIDNMQAETIEKVLDDDEIPEDAKEALYLRQLESSAAVGKYAGALSMAMGDNRVREALIFYGASATGRWTGSKFNPLNMKSSKEIDEQFIDLVKDVDVAGIKALYKKSPIALLGQNVRGIVCASPGRTLVDADSSQIELRIVHWLAGDEDMLDVIRKGFDPYVALAARFYNKPIESVTKDDRQKAKALALGLQYMLGAKRFVELTGMPLQKAKDTVQKYRDDNPLIVKFWDKIGKAALVCVRRGVRVRCGRLTFAMSGDWLTMILPSGRALHYYKPKVDTGRFGKPAVFLRTRGGEYHEVHSGHWLENAAQAICRDLLCYWMLDLEGRGLDILLNVYDQILAEADEDNQDEAAAEVRDAMMICPDWAEGLPLGVGVDLKKRWVKT